MIDFHQKEIKRTATENNKKTNKKLKRVEDFTRKKNLSEKAMRKQDKIKERKNKK